MKIVPLLPALDMLNKMGAKFLGEQCKLLDEACIFKLWPMLFLLTQLVARTSSRHEDVLHIRQL